MAESTTRGAAPDFETVETELGTELPSALRQSLLAFAAAASRQDAEACCAVEKGVDAALSRIGELCFYDDP